MGGPPGAVGWKLRPDDHGARHGLILDLERRLADEQLVRENATSPGKIRGFWRETQANSVQEKLQLKPPGQKSRVFISRGTIAATAPKRYPISKQMKNWKDKISSGSVENEVNVLPRRVGLLCTDFL
jgi:hypothetical protein